MAEPASLPRPAVQRPNRWAQRGGSVSSPEIPRHVEQRAYAALEHERIAVVGAWNDNADRAFMLEALKPDEFTDFAARAGYLALEETARRGLDASEIAVRQILWRENQHEAVQHLNSVESELQVVTPTEFRGAIRWVQQNAARKRLRVAAQCIQAELDEDAIPLQEVFERGSRALCQAAAGLQQRKPQDWHQGLTDLGNQLAAGHSTQGLRKTGLADLDRRMEGICELTVLAARPAMGKTAKALQIARHVARTEGAVFLWSGEMSASRIYRRMAAQEKQIQLRDVKATTAYEVADQRLKIEVYDRPLRLSGLRALLYECRVRHPDLALVIVDYLSLLADDVSEYKDVSRVSRGLKELSSEHGIPVLALQQLSRAVEQRNDKRPLLSDLRESGQIEQDATNVMFLYREHVYNKKADRHKAELIIAKQRDGQTGTVPLYWKGETLSFFGWSDAPAEERERPDDQPDYGRVAEEGSY